MIALGLSVEDEIPTEEVVEAVGGEEVKTEGADESVSRMEE